MSRLARVRRLARAHPRLADAAYAVLFVLSIAVVPTVLDFPDNSELTRFGRIATYFLCAALALRRRWPLTVFGLAVAGQLVELLNQGTPIPLVPIVVIAAYTVAAHTSRAKALIAGGVAVVAWAVASMVVVGSPQGAVGKFYLVVWLAMSIAAGDGIRTRRQYVAFVEERARRAEQSRDEEARRRVAEERLRIARELHDIVAHNIALINVQAGVAAHLMRSKPEEAERALTHVRQASRSVLEELTALLGVLRESDDVDVPMEPAPSLNRLDRLIEGLRTAGLAVDCQTTGPRRALPAATDLVAYRVLQESLTNVHKHGAGASAKVKLTYTPSQLMIEVRNTTRGLPAGRVVINGHGHGIVGMRERAAAVGGQLRADAVAGGEFVVTACLPLPDWSDR